MAMDSGSSTIPVAGSTLAMSLRHSHIGNLAVHLDAPYRQTNIIPGAAVMILAIVSGTATATEHPAAPLHA